ncbi:hypothetical protein IV45_GL000548 [Limosilactobacillus secaliphilus]|uniref:Uncharacterized protein n=2 Tax=Limosilactobacillus secaliphilus TaxID=396268 RepID=A0A0R2I8D2_9LACO|nr:hypothetical protein IV45_GL000548 [Limosilactobacillus secaliphilus]
MMHDDSGDPQAREFMQFGVPVCKVTFNREQDQFIVERYEPDRRMIFDDLDLVAIEVYDCLYDFRHSF